MAGANGEQFTVKHGIEWSAKPLQRLPSTLLGLLKLIEPVPRAIGEVQAPATGVKLIPKLGRRLEDLHKARKRLRLSDQGGWMPWQDAHSPEAPDLFDQVAAQHVSVAAPP